MEKQYCGFKSILVCSYDLNPYFEHKKMNPNFNLFMGSAQVHLGGDSRGRSGDLLNAIQALYQLSYTPYAISNYRPHIAVNLKSLGI